jgi:hypothetical protein
MFDKGDIPSFLGKMSLSGPKYLGINVAICPKFYWGQVFLMQFSLNNSSLKFQRIWCVGKFIIDNEVIFVFSLRLSASYLVYAGWGLMEYLSVCRYIVVPFTENKCSINFIHLW